MFDSLKKIDALERNLSRWLPPRPPDREGPTWAEIARPEQLPPDGSWLTWLLLAGRGWGKTRTGSETVNLWAREARIRIHLVARTAGDVRDVMVEGESGICSLYPDVKWEPSKRRLVWPNGSIATTFSADKPDQLRGPQCHRAWADELAAWRYPDAWDQLMLGLRLGDDTRAIVTTTPRPTKLIRRLAKDETSRLTGGSTYDNAANLSPTFLEAIKKAYEGMRLGRQELYAHILDDVPGALWTLDMIDSAREALHPPLDRVVVAIDPAGTDKASSDETGIIVAGVCGSDVYVLDDLSGRYTPNAWAREAVKAFDDHDADRIVAEVNFGGQMVEHTLRTVRSLIPYKAVTAARGKRIRAEPIAALYEQGRVHHVGVFDDLESQLTEWDASDGSPSPDRLDALVWALTDLVKPSQPNAYGRMRRKGAQRRM